MPVVAQRRPIEAVDRLVGSWADVRASRWIQSALTTPVLWWAGWPFFRLGWRSRMTRNLNSFTLIAVGVGAAFVSSAVARCLWMASSRKAIPRLRNP